MARARGPIAGVLEYLNELGWSDLRADALGRTAPTPQPPTPKPPDRRSHPGQAARPKPQSRPQPAAGTKTAAVPAPSAAPKRAPLAPIETPTDLASLAACAAECTRCRLAEGRNRVVFGSGSAQADLMFIGEGPGAEEDKQGLPFVGAAGELLTKIIGAIELRREDVYIANVVKCRPPNNRDPFPDEVAACRGYLEHQIDLVKPKLIVLLGRVAAQTLLGTDRSLGAMRGRWHDVHGVPARVTYHPAAMLYQPSYKRPTWEDMQLVRDRLRADPA